MAVFRESHRTLYHGIACLGVGHIEKDLVLVPDDGAAVDIPPDQWTRFEVHQIDDPPQHQEPLEQEQPYGRRAITFDDLPSGDPSSEVTPPLH